LGLDLDECGCHSVRESNKFFVFLNPPDGRWDNLDLSGRDRRENSLAFWRIPSLPTPGRLPHCLLPTTLDDGGSRRRGDKGKNVE